MIDTKQYSKQRIPTAGKATLAIGMVAMGLGLTGCGMLGGPSSSTTGSVPGSSSYQGLRGNVHGGQQPVIGAAIQLYAVGSGSYGAAAIPLIPAADQIVYGGANTGAKTDSNGDFQITGDYSCTRSATGTTISDAQVYVVATGGTSLGFGGAVNSAIALMAPLGDCNTLVANAGSTFVQLNEVSSVAAVFSLAPYMTSYSAVGAPTANNTGLINAVGNFNNLANLTTGYPSGANLPAGATIPVAEISTLADIMASCINTNGLGSSTCSTLSSATGGATDTIGMMLYFAKNPGSASLTALYAQGTGVGAPFQPVLGSQPNDWTIAIKYTGGGNFLAPYNIAIDAVGDAWVTNAAGSSVIELMPSGAVGTTLTGSLVGPKGIAIDRTGNVWVANPTAGTVVKFTGGAGTGTAYTVGTGPVALALDSAGTAWVANQLSNSISSVTSGGTVTSYSTGLGLNGPTGIAIDSITGSGGGNIYVANSGSGNVVKLTNAGAVAAGSPFTDNALQGTINIALDSANNVYALGSLTGSVSQAAVSQFTNAGVAASYSPVSTPAATGIYPGIVVNGSNKVVLTNSVTSGNIQAVALGATPVTVVYGSLNTPVGIAVDPSGDVWTANSGDNTVSEFVGLVTPVTTPLAANVGP